MQNQRQIIVANWKMNGRPGMAKALATTVAEASRNAAAAVVLCPPATLMAEVRAAIAGSKLALGGQDCHFQPEGAFTGDISAAMLKDAGCAYVIVGHSERRTLHGESSETVKCKAQAAARAGLVPIICIGETEKERQQGQAEAVVARQIAESVPEGMSDLVLAYEPVWAIGSGKTPTAEDIGRMHAYIAAAAAGSRAKVLYGGSVKASNAKEILAINGVAGALVGGASLKAEEFCKIIESAA